MRQSQLFTKAKKEVPADEVSKNASLLIRAGYIYKEMAGAYAFLPLGLRVLEKIKNIVREEMNGLGAQELLMTALQRKELWEITNRWDDKQVDVWFKSMLKSGGEVGFGWSHEEPITEMMKNYIGSYRDLPVVVYQFQTKLRNELRAKSGIMRGREFLMKDMYSYAVDEDAHGAFYSSAIEAYKRVFERVGLGDRTFLTFASGGAFTQFSHEFQTISDVGEDVIYVHRGKGIAINKEVLIDEVLEELGVRREDLEEERAVEVGNIFSFKTAKSETLGLSFKNEKGETVPVTLGSYGIGITRLMGVLVETFADEKGIVWPKAASPFAVHLLALGAKGTPAHEQAERTYAFLEKKGIEVLFDDRDMRAGEKFAESDLLGIPLRAVVSEKTMHEGRVEVKGRSEETGRLATLEELVERAREGQHV